MSLIRMAIRLCAVGALRGRTWAGQRVYDSDNTPLAMALAVGDEPRPYMVVYTDADTRQNIPGKELYSAVRGIALTLEIAVASAVEVENGGKAIRIPNTDQGMEAAIDVTDHQAIAALFGDPENPWAELLRRFINHFERIPSQRGGRAERGTRWAARQVTFVMNTLTDMPPGVPWPQKHVLRDFIALAKSYPLSDDLKMKDAANLMEAIIDGVTPYPSWEQAQSWLTSTRPTLRKIGLAPLVEDGQTIVIVSENGTDIVLQPSRAAPILDELTLKDEDTFTADSIDYVEP